MYTPRASSISVANISRTAPLSVRRPSPRRLYGVCPEPFVPKSNNLFDPSEFGRIKNRAHLRSQGYEAETDGHDISEQVVQVNFVEVVQIVQSELSIFHQLGRQDLFFCPIVIAEP